MDIIVFAYNKKYYQGNSLLQALEAAKQAFQTQGEAELLFLENGELTAHAVYDGTNIIMDF